MNSFVLPLVLLLPPALAGLVLFRPRGWTRTVMPWAPLPVLLAALLGVPKFDYSWLLPGAVLGLDDLSLRLLPATAILWLSAGLVAHRYLAPDRRRDYFFVWFALAMTGNFLLLAAMDAVLFYLGFALMSFSSYGLVVHANDKRSRHAGRFYIAMVVFGEVCVISGLLLLASRVETAFAAMQASLTVGDPARNHLIMGLLITGFGIKAGLVGLHFWLPLAHPVAPAPASAVLSGAMIKAGVVAWLRFFPLGDAVIPGWGLALVLAGLLTALYGVLVGVGQREPKTVLAYSSVSQMGLIGMAVGLGLMFPQAWPALLVAIVIFIVHHGLVKGSLFLGAGLVAHALRPASARLAMVVLVAGGLALAAGPLTGGLVAKSALAKAIVHTGPPWQGLIPDLLLASSVLTALLMIRFLVVARPARDSRAAPTSPALLLPWLAVAVLGLAWPWLLADAELRQYLFAVKTQGSALLPVLLAVMIAAGAMALHRRGWLHALPAPPPGDFGIVLEKWLLWLGRLVRRLCSDFLPRMRDAVPSTLIARSPPIGFWRHGLKMAEANLQSWSVTATFLIVLAIVLTWLWN